MQRVELDNRKIKITQRIKSKVDNLTAPSTSKQETAAMHLRSIIIPAAGLGARSLPVTKSAQKELFNVHDKPIQQSAIDDPQFISARIVGSAKLPIKINDWPSAARRLDTHIHAFEGTTP